MNTMYEWIRIVRIRDRFFYLKDFYEFDFRGNITKHKTQMSYSKPLRHLTQILVIQAIVDGGPGPTLLDNIAMHQSDPLAMEAGASIGTRAYVITSIVNNTRLTSKGKINFS